eukprot:Platyproteum_vivax@DN751_c0_g1_i1.p1
MLSKFSVAKPRYFMTRAMTSYKLPPLDLQLNSKVFERQQITMADKQEWIVRGNRGLFPKIPEALKGVKKIGIIGWGSQGPAQAQNLRESLEGSQVEVVVGVRPESVATHPANQAGFTQANGTLKSMWEVLAECQLNIVLISDAACASLYPKIFETVKPGTTLGLSHGFLLGHLNTVGQKFPTHVNVVAVCPKGVGPSVRRLYEQGREVNGSGINASVAVHQDVTGDALDHALGWSVGIGSPVTFATTLEAEYKSDIYGERGILLGAVHGMCEMLYRLLKRAGKNPEEAYRMSVETITGSLSKAISHNGLLSVYEMYSGGDKEAFELAYSAAYPAAMEILLECYEDVASGREIASVLDASARFQKFPMGKIDNTELWHVAARVRGQGKKEALPIDPTVAGVYLATMVAQCDLLMQAGHAYSEVANESIIEAVDSLNPYMAFKGVAYMVDNCSITARLGSRKWAPRFDYLFEQQTVPKIENKAPVDTALIEAFKTSKIHKIMEVCSSLRPPVDIVPHITHLG